MQSVIACFTMVRSEREEHSGEKGKEFRRSGSKAGFGILLQLDMQTPGQEAVIIDS